jgi:hypothetical protein
MLDADLKDIARIDRLREHDPLLDTALVFQEGFVMNGPRTYDIFDGKPPVQVNRVTQDWPMGTMNRRLDSRGLAYIECQQELGPNQYGSSNVIYSGAHRRCTMTAKSFDGQTWSTPLKQDEVAEIIDILDDGSVAGIVRSKSNADQLVIWKKDQPSQSLGWFPVGYDTKLQDANKGMSRYMGSGANSDGGPWELRIFDRSSKTPLVSRAIAKSSRAALSPDGLRYATFENGELRIYSLPSGR